MDPRSDAVALRSFLVAKSNINTPIPSQIANIVSFVDNEIVFHKPSAREPLTTRVGLSGM
jgi:hypothetical protein